MSVTDLASYRDKHRPYIDMPTEELRELLYIREVQREYAKARRIRAELARRQNIWMPEEL